LRELRLVAERCKSLLSLHSHRGRGFFLFSDMAPKKLCDRIVERIRDNGMGVVSGRELGKRAYRGKIGVRDGVVESALRWKTNLDGWVRDSSVSAESPKHVAKRCSKIVAMTYIDFYNGE
jgi:hypothetical protein